MAIKKELWTEADVRCPFFLSEDRKSRSIRCEGYKDGVATVLSFDSLELKNRHMGLMCAGPFQRCPFYECIYKLKYADDDI